MKTQIKEVKKPSNGMIATAIVFTILLFPLGIAIFIAHFMQMRKYKKYMAAIGKAV